MAHKSEQNYHTLTMGLLFSLCSLFVHLQHTVLTVMWKTEEKPFVQAEIIIPPKKGGIMIYVFPVAAFTFNMWWKLCRLIAYIPQPNDAFIGLLHI